MFTLTIIGLVCALAWLARRQWLLGRGVKLLAAALEQRRQFLSEDEDLPRIHRSWSKLAAASNRLLADLARSDELHAGRLAQLETALGNLQEAVLIVDRNNYVLMANRALHTTFPDVGEIVAQRVEVVLKSADFLAYLADVRAGTAASRREIEFFGPCGKLWFEATGVQVPAGDERNGPWTLFVLHEITKQKQLESVQREFVANVSHELKTPLSVIKGYAETLADDHPNMSEPDREQFIRTIQRHAERLAALVEDLLTISRLESANTGIHLAVQDLGLFVRSLAEDYEAMLHESGHRLELAIAGAGRVPVAFDTLRLTQVMSNLLENAQKYTPRGALVEIGLRPNVAAGTVEVWVRDNGPGIPAVDLPRIFERFYRVEKGRSREKGGTGLGLSIVRNIVQLHGGRAWAESQVGEGTRVVFTLPMQATAPAALEGTHGEPVHEIVAPEAR